MNHRESCPARVNGAIEDGLARAAGCVRHADEWFAAIRPWRRRLGLGVVAIVVVGVSALTARHLGAFISDLVSVSLVAAIIEGSKWLFKRRLSAPVEN